MNLNIDILRIICEHLDVFDQTCLSYTCRLYTKELGIHGNDARWSTKLMDLIKLYPELREIVQSDLIQFNLYNTPMFIKTLYQYHFYTLEIMKNKSIIYDCEYNLEMIDSFSGSLIHIENDSDITNFKRIMYDKYKLQTKSAIERNNHLENIFSIPLVNIFKVRNKIERRKQRSIDYKYNKPFIVIQTIINILIQRTVFNPNNNNVYSRFTYNEIRDYLLKHHKVRGFKNMINEYGLLHIDEAQLIKTQQLEDIYTLLNYTGNNHNYSFDRIDTSSRYRLKFTRVHSNEGGWGIWF